MNFSLQFLNITQQSGNEKTQPISWRVQYENNPHSHEYYLTSSENKAWKKFRPVQDLTHDLCNTGSSLPTELTSLLGAGHYVLEFLTFHYWLSSIYNCKDHFHFVSSTTVHIYMIFIYLQPFIQLKGVIMICYQIIFKELCTQAARRKPLNISMHFLSTVLCTFLKVLIKEFV